MKNHIVSYYSHVDKVFVHVGKDPIKHSEQTSAIHPFELDSKNPLQISLKRARTDKVER